MYIDRNLVLTGVTAGTNGYTPTGQAVTASAASTDYLDTLAAGFSFNQLYAVIQCLEAATAAGSATIQISLQSADDASFSTNLTDHLMTGAIPKASCTLNKTIAAIDMSGINFRRYVRAYFTVATGPLTAGKFSVFFTPALPLPI